MERNNFQEATSHIRWCLCGPSNYVCRRFKAIMGYNIEKIKLRRILNDELKDKMKQAWCQVLYLFDKKMEKLNSDEEHSDANERSYKYFEWKENRNIIVV